MSGELRITRLRLIGPGGAQVYEFPRRVTVITGPVGAGKTTLLNAVKYGLGGSWRPPQMIRPALAYVELEGRLGDTRLALKRPFVGSTGTVQVTLGDDASQLLPVSGRGDLTLSTVLLERLGLPDVRVPEAPTDPTEDDRAVTFADVLSLMYLDQSQIDGTVGFSGTRHVKWRQTVEVVYGFTTNEIARLQAELGAANSDLARTSRYIGEVERFMIAVGLPSEGDDELRRTRLNASLAALDRDLTRLREQSEGPTDASMRRVLTEAEQGLVAARVSAAQALAQLTAMRRVGAQLQADLANVQRAAGAYVLRELEFEQCPRCMTPLPDRSPGTDCRLCQQPEPPPAGVLVTEIEQRRIRRQQVETKALLDDALSHYERTIELVDIGERERERASVAWNALAAAAMAPRIEQIAALSEQRGGLLRERDTLDRTTRMRTELQNAKKEKARLIAEKTRVESALNLARSHQERARETITTLGTSYEELLRRMQLQDLRTASIDPRSFVPLVNDEAIPALSSGGMKTMASFAYFLAALQIRLAGEPSLLPRFMMIDSPRKGHGKNAVDEASMARFYRSLSTFARLSSRSEFQVIVADNDTPIAEKGEFGIIALTNEKRSVDIAALTRSRQPDE